MNAPKLFAKAAAIQAIILGVILIVIGVGLSIWLTNNGAMLGLEVGFIPGILGIVLGIVSLRQLKNSTNISPEFAQFQTSTVVNYTPIRQAVAIQQDEQVQNWVGPVQRFKLIGGFTLLRKETNSVPENTLIFTNRSIIALMLGPSDLQQIENGGLGGTVERILEVAPGSSMQKNEEFEILNTTKWALMMQALLLQPLPQLLENHLYYAVDYGEIATAHVRKNFPNPGVKLLLKNGQTLRYNSLANDRLEEVEKFLSTVVPVA